MRPRGLLPIVIALALLTVACDQREEPVAEKPTVAFCDAVVKLEDRLNRVPYITAAEWVTLFEAVATNAPTPVRADADLFLDGLRRVTDEPDLKDQDKYKKASERVQRYAISGCGLHQSDSGI